jgi:L-ascorbate metabolism protein UlaG (beta-lactamase superfamily)
MCESSPTTGSETGGGQREAALAVTWAGHSTVLIELDGVRILTDPLLGKRVGPLARYAPPVDAAVSERLDGVLLSHLHADHAHLRSLRRIGGSPQLIAPYGARRWLERHRVAVARELRPGERTQLGAVRVSATRASHGDRRHPLGPRAVPVGFMLEGSLRCYFAGDTDLFADMASLGAPDLALLPIWGWGSGVGGGHLDPERAAIATGTIAPRVVVPIHWGTLSLASHPRGPEDPGEPARRFQALVAERAPSVEVRTLAVGERTELRRR